MSTRTDPNPHDEGDSAPSAGWKIWAWRPTGQGIARGNARGASIALAEQRVEREDVDDFLERVAEARTSPVKNPV